MLYLIDSIVKNVAGAYPEYFGKSIGKIFSEVFEQVNGDVRKKMYALRRTWSKIFPVSILRELDNNVSKLDSKWPSTQEISPDGCTDPDLSLMHFKKTKLLELQKIKLELELAATKKQLEIVAPKRPHSSINEANDIFNSNDISNSQMKSTNSDHLSNTYSHDLLPVPQIVSVPPIPVTTSSNVIKRGNEMMDSSQTKTKKLKIQKLKIMFGNEHMDFKNDVDMRSFHLKFDQNGCDVGVFDGVRNNWPQNPFSFKRRRQENERPQSNSFAPPIINNELIPPWQKSESKTKWDPPWEGKHKRPVLSIHTMPTNETREFPFKQRRRKQVNINGNGMANISVRHHQLMENSRRFGNKIESKMTREPESHSSNPAESISQLSSVDVKNIYQTIEILNKNKEKSLSIGKVKPTFVHLSKPETLKKRQPAIINTLFRGMQCCNCGIRFPPEQTNKYSNHLDWHYRQNRRESDSARKAQYRKWYYSVADWIQYEEIENLDEREKNWFETQQTEVDLVSEESNQRSASPPPSCVAGPDDHNKTCDMCHDPFETFYNEETKEWHLRNATRVEDNIYHPICYEDYKASLTLDESHLNASSIGEISTDDNAVDIPMKSEDDPSSVGLPNSTNDRIPILDDDDDVIVLPQEEMVITEIPDDDENDPKDSSSAQQSTNHSQGEFEENPSELDLSSSGQPNNENVQEEDEAVRHNESDVQILEPQISVLNLDDYEETARDESHLPLVTKIQEEPKYEGYEDDEDDGFEDVGQTFEADLAEILEEASVEDSTPLPAIQPQSAPIASIDGNIEIQDAQPVTIGTNKIKINISTNVQLNENSIKFVPKHNGEASDAHQQVGAIEENIEIEYEVKESIKHVQFKRQPVFPSGLESSGLCSIM